MKRIALIAAAVILTACGGAKDEAEPVVEDAPAAAVIDSTVDTMSADSTEVPDSIPATPDSASL